MCHSGKCECWASCSPYTFSNKIHVRPLHLAQKWIENRENVKFRLFLRGWEGEGLSRGSPHHRIIKSESTSSQVGNPQGREGVCRQRSSHPIRQSFGTRPGGDTSCASGEDFNCSLGCEGTRTVTTKKQPRLIAYILRSVKWGSTVSSVSRRVSGGQSRSGS